LKALEGKPLIDLVTLSNEIHELMIGHYRLVRYGLPVHNIGMNLLTQSCSRGSSEQRRGAASTRYSSQGYRIRRRRPTGG
jgi:hypothetical protein